MKKIFQILSPELIFWTAGLLFLAFYPFSGNHFTICPLKNLGFSFCPGCGLGMSLHNLFHLQIKDSFNSHPLGIAALFIIGCRIITLTRNSITHYTIRRNYNG